MSNLIENRILKLTNNIYLALLVLACAITQTYFEKGNIIAPTPIRDTQRASLSPITSEEVGEKGMTASIGADLGCFAGQNVTKAIRSVGRILDDRPGMAMGKVFQHLYFDNSNSGEQVHA